MASQLVHRGPDSGGVWVDAEAGLCLAHRRLAIVDLSPAGHQPMLSADGRMVIVYNGEVYNAAELRAELEADGLRTAWRGHSDTEAIVEACARWGVERTVRRLIGMFAFALWDRRERRLFLVRDRIGIKPLFWSERDGTILFGSELKALFGHPEFVDEIDRTALCDYLGLGYVPAPKTIFRNVHKLPPGTVMVVDEDGHVRQSPFWSLETVIDGGAADRRRENLDDGETIEALDRLLRDAVRRRMIADVPLGAFLSGGIDSTVVASLMQDQSAGKVRTFSIGFHSSGYDEAQHAKAVARHLGTDHTEHYVGTQDLLNVIPRLPTLYDEPMSDVSGIPTFLVSELARRHVTVALSGDGGDELFAGYTRYLAYLKLQRLGGFGVGAPVLAALIRAVPPGRWQSLFNVLPAKLRPFGAGDRLHKMAVALGARSADEYHSTVMGQWPSPGELVEGGFDAGGGALPLGLEDAIERMQYRDMRWYLPDDILAKVDRASMGVALEARVPLLDHRVVEFAWSLPAHFKTRNGAGKWLLRQVAYKYVPKALLDRPKQGFAAPVADWLRGPLRDWGEDLLSEPSLRRAGALQPGPIRRAWAEHQSGRTNRQRGLWTVLVFLAWQRTSFRPVTPPGTGFECHPVTPFGGT